MPHHWDEVAELRKQQIETGLDLTFSKVFIPYFVQIVSQSAVRSILEVGGGTGHLALALNGITDRYVMLEPSPGMYRVASRVLAGSRTETHHCTVESFPVSGGFDLVLSHMCVQVVADLGSFLRAVSSQMSRAGRFLLSLPHPVFYNDYKEFFQPEDFHYMEEQNKKVSFSITLDPNQVIDSVPYHHRPLSRYVSSLVSAGLCVDLLEEIYPDKEVQQLYGQRWNVPRYLVFGGHRAESRSRVQADS